MQNSINSYFMHQKPLEVIRSCESAAAEKIIPYTFAGFSQSACAMSYKNDDDGQASSAGETEEKRKYEPSE
jgi:hypothetical protein